LFNAADFQRRTFPICPSSGPEPAHPRLTFRNRLGRVIAYAHIRPTGCARADIVVSHHRFEALDLTTGSGATLVSRLTKLGALPR
jgi:hypothetical protein